MSRSRKALLLGGLFVFPAAFIAVGAVFCAFTLHVQRRTGPKPPGAAAVQILANDQAVFKAWWFHPAPSTTANGNCVILLHGISDSRASSSGFAPMFLSAGYSALAPDSRAHGESGGSVVTYGLREKYDVLAWADWLKARGCQKIYGLGESLGAAILIQATAVEPIFAAIVAECPYSNLRRMAEYRVRGMLPAVPVALSSPLATVVANAGFFYARTFEKLDFAQVAPALSMAASTTPVLLIHGLEDDHTPPAESQELYACRPRNTELWLVPHANHTQASSVAPGEFHDRVLTWFARH